ncbi:universal stress protein [Mangrovibacterium diazotrophicum]|uniref:Nucleotide-binding universal stress UspA family protein n=1 Tax=Mangrovibacterium diazotrophicum TaxID=1261403 RepID=A0A419W9U9_9BACT|nr:universal stress protein [Mangrovibacterium diazotrophicum]RKD92250.1 nucleotide-binding universal stress UspA family protein [Mangrovibacterium diazotrophicum]
MIKTTVHRVLVPITLDDQGASAIRRAQEIHEKFETKITLLYVVPEESVITDWFRPIRKQSNLLEHRKALKAFIAKHFDGKLPSYVRLKVRSGSLTKCIVRMLNHFRYDLVVLNKKLEQSPKLQSAWANGIKLIVGEALCPVLTYDGDDKPFNIKTIMVPVDIFQPHKHKVAWAIRLAKVFGSKVHVVSALKANIEEEDSMIYKKIKGVRYRLEEEGIETEATLLREEAGRKLHDLIPEFIDETNPDLTLIMTHQENIFDFNYIGKLASEVILRTKAPVFSITPKKETIVATLKQ